MLTINFVAIHTTSMVGFLMAMMQPTATDFPAVFQSFVHAMYNFAAQKKYQDALRSEVEENLGSDVRTWTREALARCWKLDSFLKETQRTNGMGARESAMIYSL